MTQDNTVIIFKNIFERNERQRVNRLRLKKLEDGKIFITINNGKMPDGSDRFSSIMLEKENIENLKKWLDVNG